MNKQEAQIIRLLLNEMAFEGAMKHFNEVLPDVDMKLFGQLEDIGAPLRYDEINRVYRHVNVDFSDDLCVFKNCYKYLRIIRNNIIHANKAYRPDTPERLTDLLEWSDMFIDAVYNSDGPFAQRALEIKAALRIESF